MTPEEHAERIASTLDEYVKVLHGEVAVASKEDLRCLVIDIGHWYSTMLNDEPEEEV